MKKILTTALALLFVCIVFVTACGPAGLKDNPERNVTVYGNGGMAAVKGDYLYFVNGYQDYTLYTDINKDNKFGSVTRSGIYRTKLVDGEVVRDENGFVVNVECVVPQCVGFDNGSFYIVGDYIYYVTPHMENSNVDGNKQLMNSWVDVCRIKIDGTDQERLFYTTNDAKDLKWTIYTIDNNPYIVMLDKSELLCYDVENDETVKMAENVSVALLHQENYTFNSTNLTEAEQYIYYTREYKDDENHVAGNKLCKVKIGTSEEIVVAADNENKFTIKQIANGYVYYTKVQDDGNSWVESLYRRQMQAGNASGEEIKVCSGYSKYYVIENGIGEYVIALDSNNWMYLVNNTQRTIIYKGGSSINILGLDDNKVYFVESSKIYSVSYVDGLQDEATLITNSDKTYKLDNTNLIDFDGRRLYVLASYTSESGESYYYLNLIDRYDTDTESEFVGDMSANERPAEPEEYENEDGEMVKDLWVK
ncbi:MAG: hypothetical protein IJA61_04030 [Clostridia bacterium]|nr:hypothetical protein [Clostridia bacterium]